MAHGGWRNWLEERGISKSTAHRLIALSQLIDLSQVGTFESVQAALDSAKKPHVSQASGENEWYTPPEIIEVCRARD